MVDFFRLDQILGYMHSLCLGYGLLWIKKWFVPIRYTPPSQKKLADWIRSVGLSLRAIPRDVVYQFEHFLRRNSLFSLFFRLPTKVTIDRSSIREPNSLGSSARNPAAYVTGYGGVVDVAH